MMPGESRSFGPRLYAAVALFFALFTLYGSYVPFRYHDRDFDEAVDSYRSILSQGVKPVSRSDWAANVMLGVPLGFCLLGMIRVNRTHRLQTMMWGIGITFGCAGFAALVEFGQLFFHGRTCAGSDIMAQAVGALIGVLTWSMFGNWFTDQLRNALRNPHLSGGATRILAAYVVLLAAVQWLPLDLTASPHTLYKRLRDNTTWNPFGELIHSPVKPLVNEWEKIGAWCELFMLAVPVGLLLAPAFRSRARTGTVILGSIALGSLSELGQVFVQSRHPSMTDVIIIAGAVLLSWKLSVHLGTQQARKFRYEWLLALTQFWFLLMAIMHWQPFEFRPLMLDQNWQHVSWMPLSGQSEKNYLWALNEVLTKFLIFTPMGALVVWTARHPENRQTVLLAAGIVAGFATILEIGQLCTPTRYASPTDVLFGLVGGWIGGEIVRRMMVGHLHIVVSTQQEPWWTKDPTRAGIGANVMESRPL